MEGFSTPEVGRLTGVNPKTLHYWDKTGLISPSITQAHGTGTRRVYGFRDVVAIRTAHVLREAGVSTQALRQIVEYIAAMGNVENPLAETYLIVRGGEIYAVQGNSVMNVLREPGQYVFSFVVDMKQTVEDVRRKCTTIKGLVGYAEKKKEQAASKL